MPRDAIGWLEKGASKHEKEGEKEEPTPRKTKWGRKVQGHTTHSHVESSGKRGKGVRRVVSRHVFEQRRRVLYLRKKKKKDGLAVKAEKTKPRLGPSFKGEAEK